MNLETRREVRPDHRRPRGRTSLVARCRMVTALLLSTVILAGGSLIMLLVAMLTFFQARRLYTEVIAKWMARLALWLFGVHIVEHRTQHLPQSQTVFISNHTSVLDMFVIIALGLPNSRYFLSGFLRWYLPLLLVGWLIGIFWTALQIHPQKRTAIFQNAERVLRRTRESVFLTPEGQITGRFNKGAFHLATNLHAPLLPIYIQIPNEVDPGPWSNGDGLAIRPGTVHLYYKSPIDTQHWRLEDLDDNRNSVRDLYLAWEKELNHTQQGA